MDSSGSASSSVMVPTALDDVPSVAFVGEDSLTRNVSSCSSTASWVVCTSTTALVRPARMVAVFAVTTGV